MFIFSLTFLLNFRLDSYCHLLSQRLATHSVSSVATSCNLSWLWRVYIFGLLFWAAWQFPCWAFSFSELCALCCWASPRCGPRVAEFLVHSGPCDLILEPGFVSLYTPFVIFTAFWVRMLDLGACWMLGWFFSAISIFPSVSFLVLWSSHVFLLVLSP